MQQLIHFFDMYGWSMVLIAISVVAFIIAFSVMRFRYPYQSAKRHGFIIAGIALIMAVIYAMELYAHFKDLQYWIAIADNILSGSIFAILCFLFWGVEKRIKNRSEDAEKLRQDYDNLSQKYSRDSLVKAVNRNGEPVIYPVIRLGTGRILLTREDSTQICIMDEPYEYYRLPTIIENHYSDIFSIHDTSNIYNNLNIRVTSMSFENNRLVLSAMRTTYYDSLVTNRASDYPLADGLSVRELFETGPRMTPLEKSRLSNHLGFNGFVESSDGYIVFVKRSGDMSIAKRTYGDSIGASLKTKYALDGNGFFTYQGLRTAVIREINDELKIKTEDIDLDTLSLVAAYRDCVECGKPQLLIYAKSRLTAEEISENFEKLRREKLTAGKKVSKRQRQELDALEDGTKLIWMHRNMLENDVVYRSDRIELAKGPEKEGFVSFGRKKGRPVSVPFLKMVPSASASVYLLKESLKSPKIIESRIASRYPDQTLCEDDLVIGSDIIAVIDGATAKSAFKWGGKSSGKYASLVLRKAIEGGVTTQSPYAFFSALSRALQDAAGRHPEAGIADLPRASLIAYVADKHEIWSYGDCQCIVGDDCFSHKKAIDLVLGNKRAAIIEERLACGDAPMDLIQHDFGRDAILKDLLRQLQYENVHAFADGYDLGYPVLNGGPICEDMIAVHMVPKGSIVVLASDGYPVLKNTLCDSEAELAELLASDPLCFRKHKSTKGLAAGCVSFDDRTYVRFEA